MTSTEVRSNPTEHHVPTTQELESTIRHFGTMLPGEPLVDAVATIEEAIEYLEGPSREWKTGGKMNLEGGMWVVKMPTEEIDRLRVPAKYGFEASSNVYDINFEPETGTTRPVDRDAEGYQKYEPILDGLIDSLEYITLVEAGYLPRPEYLVGITNHRMARIATRMGFNSVETIVEDLAKGDIDGQDEQFNATKDIFHELFAKSVNGQITDVEYEQALDFALKSAAVAKKQGDSLSYDHFVSRANKLMGPSLFDDDFLVWARYEDYRDGVLAFNQKFGAKVAKLAQIEAEKIEQQQPN